MVDEGEKRELERLPSWAPEYLACWGSKKPDGGRMTVTFAAEFSGVTPETVRKLRERSATFRRLEEVARFSGGEWAQTYVEAGLQALAPGLMRALGTLIDERNPQVVLKALEWLRGRPQEIDVLVDDVSELSDEERSSRVVALLERARARRDGPAADDEPDHA